MTCLRASLILITVFLIPFSVFGQRWVNPQKLVRDPSLARLQQGREELKGYEKQDLSRYGCTGLELISYVDINTRPGRCWDKFERAVIVTAGGHIKVFEWLWKEKYYYKNPVDILTCNGIKPGDVMRKFAGIYFTPPQRKYRGYLYLIYLTSRDKNIKDKEGWAWLHELRRYRRSPTTAKEDRWLGSVLSYDDMFLRRPWEEEHRIIGQDVIDGCACHVVESRNCINPDYYLLKRVAWVDKVNFLDLHEEQFDQKGRRTLIIDKAWIKVEPSGNWIRATWNCVNLVTNNRLVRQNFNWEFDQGFDDGDFLPASMAKEHFWKKPSRLLPVKEISDLPPLPKVRQEFWEKMKP